MFSQPPQKTPIADSANIVTWQWYQWFLQIANFAVGGVLPAVSVVAFSATPIFDANVSDTFQITLTGDVTAPTLINVQQTQEITFFIIQDAVGGHKWTWPVNIIQGAAVDQTANAKNLQTFKIMADNNGYPMGAMTTS